MLPPFLLPRPLSPFQENLPFPSRRCGNAVMMMGHRVVQDMGQRMEEFPLFFSLIFPLVRMQERLVSSMSRDNIEKAASPEEEVKKTHSSFLEYKDLKVYNIFSVRGLLRGPRGDGGLPLRPPVPVPPLLRAKHTGGRGKEGAPPEVPHLQRKDTPGQEQLCSAPAGRAAGRIRPPGAHGRTGSKVRTWQYPKK